MSELAGLPVSQLTLAIPHYGAWRADVVLSSGESPEGAVSLVIGDLELAGSVQRGGNDSADRPHLVVVGAPGWERVLEQPMSYQSAGGVRLSTVLQDLSTRADEPIEQPANADLGTHFVALPDPYGDTRLRDVLAAIRRAGHTDKWRVDPDGVTRFGPRTGVDVPEDQARQAERNAGLGLRRFGVDSIAAFLPGNIVDGEPIDRMVAHETAGRLSVEVWT